MRILLIGDYSRLHYTLAQGLKTLGHEVTVASDGDGFKNYPRDIDITRKEGGIVATLKSIVEITNKFRQFKGYDVVQIINPCFTTLNVHINEFLYRRLKKNNGKVFLGAFGEDSFWVRACLDDRTFRYSEFFVEHKSTDIAYNRGLMEKWIDSSREKANRMMANDSDGIIACLYEYYKAYQKSNPNKLVYIPLPVNTDEIPFIPIESTPDQVNFFIGINRVRSQLKGTDVMEKALNRLKEKYPNEVNIIRVEDESYDRYKQLMSTAHVVLDQLYSYSPAMNALLAMAQGKVAMSGGEPEMYELMGEYDNHSYC